MFADDRHVEVQATWGIHQRLPTVSKNRSRGRELVVRLIASVSGGVPEEHAEVITLGRSLTKRAAEGVADLGPARRVQLPH